MTGLVVGLAFGLAAGGPLAPAVAQPEYDFVLVESFDPGFGETYLFDINDLGMACGVTTKSGTIGYPGIVWAAAAGKTIIPVSWPRGISNTGVVVGVLSVHDLATGVTVNPPLLPGTYIGPYFQGVNDAGVAVGYIQTCNCSNSGGVLQVPYVWDAAGGARTVLVPNAKGLSRVNSTGLAIGWTGGNSSADGFFVDLGTGAYTMMDDVFLPEIGFGPTRVYDVNDSGQVVGTRYGSFPVYFYGYVYTPATGVRILPMPGAPYQDAVKPIGINSAGTIVGEIYRLGSSEAFVYTRADGIRPLNDPDLVAGIPLGFTMMTAQKVNDEGWIVGYGYGGGAAYKSYVLKPRLPVCYADCDQSTGAGVLDFFDFVCFQDRFSAGDPYADCDQTTGVGMFDFFDFVCFQDAFASGCP